MTNINIDLTDKAAWEINGESLTAWVNDDEFYEIAPVDQKIGATTFPAFRITLNNIQTLTAQILTHAAGLTYAQYYAHNHETIRRTGREET